MTLLDDFFEEELGPVAQAAEMKAPITSVGTFRWSVRAGVIAFAVAITSIVASPSSVAAVDGRRAVVESVRAVQRYGVVPANLQRDAAAARALLRAVREDHVVADPDYGF